MQRLILPALLSAASLFAQVDATTLDHKVLLGYQGWFDCPSESAPQNPWSHWTRRTPSPDNLTIDGYPDLTEFAPADLCALPGFTIAGKQAYLYSAWNPKIVDVHFRWMQVNGLDGVLVQRFLADIPHRRATGDIVLKNIMARRANAHGRVFAIEYDVSGASDEKFFQVMSDDWQYLVHDLKITPAAGIPPPQGQTGALNLGDGLSRPGIRQRIPEAAKRGRSLVQIRRTRRPPRDATMGGVPARWRTLGNDSRKDEAWSQVYAMMDVIQPWNVVPSYGTDLKPSTAGKPTSSSPTSPAPKNSGRFTCPWHVPRVLLGQPESRSPQESQAQPDPARRRTLLVEAGYQRTAGRGDSAQDRHVR